jgi:hypothetical protein
MDRWQAEPYWQWYMVVTGWTQLQTWAHQQQQARVQQLVAWATATRVEPTAAPKPLRWRHFITVRKQGAHQSRRGA